MWLYIAFKSKFQVHDVYSELAIITQHKPVADPVYNRKGVSYMTGKLSRRGMEVLGTIIGVLSLDNMVWEASTTAVYSYR